MIDGDDWLIRNDAFKIIRNSYRSDSELCLTFGNYMNFVSIYVNINFLEIQN